jgi:hypothetical protein
LNKPTDATQVERCYFGSPDASADTISVFNGFDGAYADDTGGIEWIRVNVDNSIYNAVVCLINTIGAYGGEAVNDINVSDPTGGQRVLLISNGVTNFTNAMRARSNITVLSAVSDMDAAAAVVGDLDTGVTYMKGANASGAASGRVYLSGQNFAGNNACPAGGVGIVAKQGSKIQFSDTADSSSFTKRMEFSFTSGANTEDYIYFVERGVHQFCGNRTTPEGAVTAVPGSTYQSNNSGKLFVKETGTGNTGWVQK